MYICLIDVGTYGSRSGVDLQNLTSRTFRCAHQRGLFTSCKTKKWSVHGKMIAPPGELLHMKDLLPERVTI